jgi:hypothetical protein
MGTNVVTQTEQPPFTQSAISNDYFECISKTALNWLTVLTIILWAAKFKPYWKWFKTKTIF